MTRNVARHENSLWLPRVTGRFYPDFVARLRDGRTLVVEYKGAMLAGAPEAREKDMIGRLWGRTTGNFFLTVQKMKNGLGPLEQMQAALTGSG